MPIKLMPSRLATVADFEALIAERNKFKAAFGEAFEKNPRYELKKGDHIYLASPNVGSAAPWRLTSFHGGEPTGHLEFSNLDSLAQEVWSLTRQGYDVLTAVN
jgi:hypothetical protein